MFSSSYNICAKCGEQVKEYAAAGDICRDCCDGDGHEHEREVWLAEETDNYINGSDDED